MGRARLLTGGPTHPFTETAPLLVALLADQGLDTTVVAEPADLVADLDGVDLLVVHALLVDALPDDDLGALDRFVRGGGGLLALHTAVICFAGDPRWHALCGASWRWERSSHPPFGAVAVDVTDAGRAHPLTDGLAPFTVDDEAYGFLDEGDDLEPLLVTDHGGRTHPVLWARTVGDGRVVTDLLGHGPASLRHPTHRTILTRAAAWATGRTP